MNDGVSKLMHIEQANHIQSIENWTYISVPEEIAVEDVGHIHLHQIRILVVERELWLIKRLRHRVCPHSTRDIQP